MGKRACVIIQGISKVKKYMRTDSEVIKDFYKFYDKKIYIDTESVLDRGLFSKIFDKLDFVPYFMNKKKRRAVCRLVNEEITRLKLDGYSVDIVGHSLGAVIAMQCGRLISPLAINRMILLQSPMHHSVYGGWIRKQIRKFSAGIEVGYVISTYNREDKWVANKIIKGFRNFIKSLDAKYSKFTQLTAGKGHDWDKALEELIVKGIV